MSQADWPRASILISSFNSVLSLKKQSWWWRRILGVPTKIPCEETSTITTYSWKSFFQIQLVQDFHHAPQHCVHRKRIAQDHRKVAAKVRELGNGHTTHEKIHKKSSKWFYSDHNISNEYIFLRHIKNCFVGQQHCYKWQVLLSHYSRLQKRQKNVIIPSLPEYVQIRFINASALKRNVDVRRSSQFENVHHKRVFKPTDFHVHAREIR